MIKGENLRVCMMAASGMEDYIFHLSNSMAKENLEVSLLIDSKNYKRFKNFFNPKLKLIHFEKLRTRDFFSPFAHKRIWNISKQIVNSSFDIFHLQNVGLWELILIMLIKGKVKVIATIHDPIKHVKPKLKNLSQIGNFLLSKINIYTFIGFLTKLTIMKSDGVIVHSESQKKDINKIATIDEKTISVQQMGAHDFYKNFEKKVAKEKSILFFGEIRPNKGCDVLIDSFLRIRDEIPEWKLVIAGRGYYWNSIKDKVGGFEDRIKTHIRFIEDDEIASFFNSSEIICTPYLHGTQSGIVSLAGVFGVCLLSFKFGNIEEILEDGKNVFFSKENTTSSLSSALVELCKNSSKRLSLAQGIRYSSLNEWSWDSISSKTIIFYRSFLSGNGESL